MYNMIKKLAVLLFGSDEICCNDSACIIGNCCCPGCGMLMF